MSTTDETVDEEAGMAPVPSLALRLKRLLIAPLLLLRRLRRPRAEAEEEEEESAPARDEEDEAPAAPPPWRRFLPHAAVLLAGIAAGSGATYWLSGQVVSRQAAALSVQEKEIDRLKKLVAGYDKMTLQDRRKLDEEKSRRAELENRLGMAQADLTRRVPPRNASAAAAQPGADKTGDCTLRPGSLGSTLKNCLQEFNRQ